MKNKLELQYQGETAPGSTTTGPARILKLKDNQIQVKITAEGMDFYDPVQHPHGLYSEQEKPKGPNRRTIVAPVNPAAGAPAANQE